MILLFIVKMRRRTPVRGSKRDEMAGTRAACILAPLLAIVAGIAPANAQNATQQLQAKAMRAVLPAEATCEWSNAGTPTCNLSEGAGKVVTLTGLDEKEGTLASGLAASNFDHSTGKVSIEEQKYIDSVQIIFGKYLTALAYFDDAVTINCLAQAGEGRPNRAGETEASNSKYILSCGAVPNKLQFAVTLNKRF
jgi:hypothetical protein